MPISGPERRSAGGGTQFRTVEGGGALRNRRSCRHDGGVCLMGKIVVAGLGFACVLAPCAVAAQVDEAALEQGRQLYGEHCALCHGDSGAGRSPAFPALSGNDLLGNAARVVRAIHEGGANMPPFPALDRGRDLRPRELRPQRLDERLRPGDGPTWRRRCWTGSRTAGPAASVWDGVFTEEQVARGRADVRRGVRPVPRPPIERRSRTIPTCVSTPPLARGAVPSRVGGTLAGRRCSRTRG